MTTPSAGALAGLLVTLMVVASTQVKGADLLPAVTVANPQPTYPGEIRGFNPQPDPPHEIKGFDPQPDPPRLAPGDGSVKPGDGSVMPAGL